MNLPAPMQVSCLRRLCSLLCQSLLEKGRPLSGGLVLVTADTWLLGNPFHEFSVSKAFVPGLVHAQPGFTVVDKTTVPAFRDRVPEMGV